MTTAEVYRPWNLSGGKFICVGTIPRCHKALECRLTRCRREKGFQPVVSLAMQASIQGVPIIIGSDLLCQMIGLPSPSGSPPSSLPLCFGGFGERLDKTQRGEPFQWSSISRVAK